ncbi:MAG: OmpA family protein [Deltaproteobacteria bacterium]|nr:OmpA family protein [Deltaproteobacteria bacterium]
MLRIISGHSLLASAAMALLGLGLLSVSCTDSGQPEEPVQSENAEIPAEPPMAESDMAGEQFSPEVVYFAFDSDNISMSGEEKLRQLVAHLQTNKNVNVQIEGHCDARGSVQYNLALGERRAQSIKKFLSDSGVEPSRLSTISWGKEKPAVPGMDESAWAQNRRAEFNLLTQ